MVNERVKDLAWKANEELNKLRSPAKGKHRLVSHSVFFLVVVELKFLYANVMPVKVKAMPVKVKARPVKAKTRGLKWKVSRLTW